MPARMTTPRARRCAIAGVAALVLVAAACGGDDDASEAPTGTGTGATDLSGLSGEIRIDGSSTVTPLISLAAEDFQIATDQHVRVPVGTSGTGGGFEKFCHDEIDISMASRPIKQEEVDACAGNGIEYFEVVVANDGLSVVVNPDNDWAECLTVEQLNAIWAPDSTVDNWNEIDPSFPDQRLTLFGAGSDSGTFDYFTAAINGEEGATRTDYNPSEDDNVTVTGVAGDKGAMGYFGLSYLLENEGTVIGVAIDDGAGCVQPSTETVQSGEYTPLSRELYIYVKKSAAQRPEVGGFVEHYLEQSDALTAEALFVPLTDAQKQVAIDELAALEAG